MFFSATLAASACTDDAATPLDCIACRALGEPCVYSINCPEGAICNDPVDDLFESTAPELVCVRVACVLDGHCTAPKTCGVDGVCHAAVCESNDACSDGLVCVAGACAAPPPTSRAARCAVMTPNQTIGAGATLTLSAIVFDADGHVLPHVPLEWRSPNDDVVTTDGGAATARGAGSILLRASLRDAPSITCDGPRLRVLAPVAEGRARVVVLEEGSGAAVEGAAITFVATGSRSASTDARGVAEVPLDGALASVTVVKPGHHTISVLSPGTRDLVITTSRDEDVTRAAGLRGRIAMPPSRGDLDMAVVYGARSPELLDYHVVPGADLVPTEIDAPELGLDRAERVLPGNVVLGLGTKRFTADEAHCRGDTVVPEGYAGCFVTRVREGRNAAWVMGGRFKMSSVVALISRGFSPEVSGRLSSKDRARLTMFLASLRQEVWYGALPYFEAEAHPKVRREGRRAVDCTAPANARTLDCAADIDRYRRAELELVGAPTIRTRLAVPELPQLPDGRCTRGLVAADYARLPGRGLVQVGLSTGEDDPETPACTVAPSELAYGVTSWSLGAGELGHIAAPLHSGMEGSHRVLVLAAIDTSDEETRPRDLSLVLETVDALGEELDLTARRFLGHPEGTLDRSAATFTLVRTSSATGTRLVLESPVGTWIVHAPASMATIALPDVAAARAVLTESTSGVVQSYALDAPYTDAWRLDAGPSIERSIEALRAIATTECFRPGPCTVD